MQAQHKQSLIYGWLMVAALLVTGCSTSDKNSAAVGECPQLIAAF